MIKNRTTLSPEILPYLARPNNRIAWVLEAISNDLFSWSKIKDYSRTLPK